TEKTPARESFLLSGTTKNNACNQERAMFPCVVYGSCVPAGKSYHLKTETEKHHRIGLEQKHIKYQKEKVFPNGSNKRCVNI
ncbi:MAG: hypothetical protein MJ078_07610, partial [Clostridia bacterium]|nr:hypothetical protein [Clostridia bacterium]